MVHTCRSVLSVAILLGFSSNSWAQTVPDAGSIRQQIEPSRALPLPKASPLPKALPPAQAVRQNAGTTVKVNAFRFEGHQLLNTEQLNMAVAKFAGRDLRFDGLQEAADAVSAAYREAGWIVRVYLPEQDVSSGVITLQIVEARFAGIRLEGSPSKRLRPSELEAWFKSRQPTGQPLNSHALDRALLLADDLPGISVAGTLAPGQSDGETALVLQTTDEPFLFGDVGLDNTGSRTTGSQRLTANLNLNSPGGRGELISLNLLHTKGSDYGRVAMTVPVEHNGLRLGVSFSSMSYKVVEGDQVANEARGSSKSMGLDWNFPLVRARTHNLYLSGGLDNKTFNNTNNNETGQNHGDYASNALRLGLSGNRFDNWGGGGANSASLQATWGQLADMQKHPQLDTIQRSYNKINYSLSRQQTLTADHSLLLTFGGQHASQVLDPSERFYIGGAQTVRAYPSSEVGGDRGQTLSAEWRWRVAPAWVVTAFADVGRVVQLEPHTALMLRGQGLSLGWQGPMGINTKLTWSKRSGTNPMPTPKGTDSDGTFKRDRFWFTASLPF